MGKKLVVSKAELIVWGLMVMEGKMRKFIKKVALSDVFFLSEQGRRQALKKCLIHSSLVLGIISSLLFLDIKEGFCENDSGKVVQRDISKATPAFQGYEFLQKKYVDIKKKYGIDVTDLEKMSQNELSKFGEQLIKEQKIFTQSDSNEKVVIEGISEMRGKDNLLSLDYHITYKGIPIYGTHRGFVIGNNKKISLYEIPSSNINISTTPSISKSQAFEIAQKHLLENAKTLELPDTIRDYQGVGYTIPQESFENPEDMRLKITKKKMKETNHLEALNLLEKCDFKKALKSPISQTSADGKVRLRVYSMRDEIHIDVRELKQALPVKIGLQDSVEMFIFPITKDSIVNYYLAGKLFLTTLPDSGKITGGNWIFWVDMKNGNILECYKGWKAD